jgi:hypothetical protein
MVALRRILAAGVLLITCGVCQAQLADCAELGAGSRNYKVVLDDLSFTTSAEAAGSGSANLKNLLTFNLSTQLAEFEKDVQELATEPPVELRVVNCLGRKPSLNGAEFTPQRIVNLSDQRVVVELWGTLLDQGAGAAAGPRAMIGYVIPPVFVPGAGATAPARFLIQYPKAGGGSPDVLHKLPEASAFALVGLAVHAKKARKYDLAVWALGRSEGSIREAQRSGETDELKRLSAYVKATACQTRKSARADAQYKGPLKFAGSDDCGVSP